MKVAVIGTGKIGLALAQALARAGHHVVLGTRQPAADGDPAASPATAAVGEAIGGADAVIVAIPAAAVEQFAADHSAALGGKVVVDATNKMGAPVVNSHEAYQRQAPGAHYARAFNCLGVEILNDPVFGERSADMFFACEEHDRGVVEELIAAVGLRPIYTGTDPTIVDGVFRLWIALAIGQRRGRQLAFATLDREPPPLS